MCDKRERFANKVWERLISEDSVHKDELDELFTVEYVNGLSGQIDDLSHTKKTRRRQTPVMTLRALQRLVMILGGKIRREDKTSSDTRYDPAGIAEARDDFGW